MVAFFWKLQHIVLLRIPCWQSITFTLHLILVLVFSFVILFCLMVFSLKSSEELHWQTVNDAVLRCVQGEGHSYCLWLSLSLLRQCLVHSPPPLSPPGKTKGVGSSVFFQVRQAVVKVFGELALFRTEDRQHNSKYLPFISPCLEHHLIFFFQY